MDNVIKIEYMGKAIRGNSEYIAKTLEALHEFSPIPGDVGRTADGKEYFCWTAGTWEEKTPSGGGGGSSGPHKDVNQEAIF